VTRLSPARFLAFALALPICAQVNVLTYQYDNTRAGANLAESTLNKANVNATGFGKLFAAAVDGYIYGQPLYLANVAIPGKGTHNVVYVATEHDSVYAFDADSSAGANSVPLWQTSFLSAVNGVGSVPAADTSCSQITPEIGITGTPVIDTATATIFVVAMTKEASGPNATFVQRLHALDISSGAEKPGSPVVIQASYPGTGEGGTTLTFNPKNYKQRPGLLLLNGTVYTAWSSHCDIGAYHGWLIGYDAQSLQQVAVYNNTANGNEGSFWAGGAAPAVDSTGNIYLVSGNGTFDYSGNGPDLGESYIKLSTTGGLSVADYFTPFNYSSLDASDLDTGSAGVALIADEAGSATHPHLMAGAGKEGRIYLLDRDNLGKRQSGSDSQIVESLPGAIGGLFGNPAYFNWTLYFCASGSSLKAFPISNAQMSSTPASQSSETFSYPGCVPTISANGKANAIVWILDPAGVLRAYDASNLASELYNSRQNAARDVLGPVVKYSVPTVVNGKVYAGTQNSLAVYGLLSPGNAAIAISNAASGDATALAPGSIAAIYGSGLAASTATATSFPIPATLGGAAVTVNGIAAPILCASPAQINVQIPFEVPAGAGSIGVTVNGAPAGTVSIAIQPGAPGLFVLQGNAAVVNPNGLVNSESQPAAPGTVISGYFTGLGAANPPVATGAPAPSSPLSMVPGQISAAIGSVPAVVQFAGLAPGFAGLYQVNILVPQMPAGQYPLQIAVGGVASNAALVDIF
jgi:uncharacterized protein (TIGR03437 family)